MAERSHGADQVLSVRSAGTTEPEALGADCARTLAGRVGLPANERRVRAGPLRRPLLDRLAPSRHAGDAGALVLAPGAETEVE